MSMRPIATAMKGMSTMSIMRATSTITKGTTTSITITTTTKRVA